MTTQSKSLTEFYQSYKQWLDNGAPQHKPYSRVMGLCGNSRIFADEVLGGDFIGDYRILRAEMKAQFEKVELDSVYAFGNRTVYDEEAGHETQHLNPQRIQWVRDHLPNG